MKHSADQGEVAASLKSYRDLMLQEAPFTSIHTLTYLKNCYSHQAGLSDIGNIILETYPIMEEKRMRDIANNAPNPFVARHQAEFSPPEIQVEITQGSTKKAGTVAFNVTVEKGKGQSHSQWEKTARELAEKLEKMGLEAAPSKGRVYVQAPKGSFAQQYLEGAQKSTNQGKNDRHR